MGATSDRRDAGFLDAVLQALPAGAFVVDAVGTIMYATDRAAEAVGQTSDHLVGESVLGYVSAETAWAYAAAVAMATDYPDVTMGPLRVELVRSDGRKRTADLWATNRLDDPIIGGIVCLLSDETAAVGLAEAMSSLAEDAPLEAIAGHVVHAMHGQPINADAALLVPTRDDPTRFELLGPTELPAELLDAAAPSARLAIETGIRQLHGDLAPLGAVVTDVAAAAGMAALWVEPVPAGLPPGDAALVLWRPRAGVPSPNQMTSIYQGAAICGLAFARDRYGAVGTA